jgi:selT/selW/selH-like putative selenoprotein
LERAVSAAQDVLSHYQHEIDELRFVTGSKGIFDVRVDGDLIYSKYETGRHARPGEVLERFREVVGPDVREYGT